MTLRLWKQSGLCCARMFSAWGWWKASELLWAFLMRQRSDYSLKYPTVKLGQDGAEEENGLSRKCFYKKTKSPSNVFDNFLVQESFQLKQDFTLYYVQSSSHSDPEIKSVIYCASQKRLSISPCKYKTKTILPCVLQLTGSEFTSEDTNYNGLTVLSSRNRKKIN